MKIHKDVLAGLHACTTTARGKNPIYANMGVSHDGKHLYAADGMLLGIGDIEDGEDLKNAVLSGEDIGTFLKGMPRTGVPIYCEFTEDVDGQLTASAPWLPNLYGRLHILPGERFPDPWGLALGHPRDIMLNRSAFAIDPDMLMRIAKIMKPFPNTFVYPGVTANTATWFIGYQQLGTVRSNLALLAMPTYVAPEDWPAAL